MSKPFKLQEVRKLLNQLHKEEITFSRFVEILNEKTNTSNMNDKIILKAFHLERDAVNSDLKLIMTTEDDEEYVFSQRTVVYDGGQAQHICKKSVDWYFDPKNK